MIIRIQRLRGFSSTSEAWCSMDLPKSDRKTYNMKSRFK